jgi:type II secretory ATPase GspE/PulE/Tfp pilus assembly ATPase PilB-like protein
LPATEAVAQVFLSDGLTPPAELPSAVGCPRCRSSGYRDRIGILKAVAVEDLAAETILPGTSEGEFRKVLRSSGTPSLLDDGLQKVSEGVTTPEEALGMRSMRVEPARPAGPRPDLCSRARLLAPPGRRRYPSGPI